MVILGGVTFGEVLEETSRVLGWGVDRADCDEKQERSIKQVVTRGLRTLFFNAVHPMSRRPHRWSCLLPEYQLRVWGDTSGTASGVPTQEGNLYRIVATSAVFLPTMVGAKLTMTTSENVYLIKEVRNVNPDPDVQTSSEVRAERYSGSESETSGDTFSVASEADYDLPDNFSNVAGELTFKSGQSGCHLVKRTNEQTIRHMRSAQTGSSLPYWFATATKPFDSKIGQRWKLMLYPKPSAVYSLRFRYQVSPVAEIDIEDRYVVGGPELAEAVMAACRMAAESWRSAAGQYTAEYPGILAAAIDQDCSREQYSLGRMGDPGTDDPWGDPRGLITRITYNGVQI